MLVLSHPFSLLTILPQTSFALLILSYTFLSVHSKLRRNLKCKLVFLFKAKRPSESNNIALLLWIAHPLAARYLAQSWTCFFVFISSLYPSLPSLGRMFFLLNYFTTASAVPLKTRHYCLLIYLFKQRSLSYLLPSAAEKRVSEVLHTPFSRARRRTEEDVL